MPRLFVCALLLCLAACAADSPVANRPPVPLGAWHQHLLSPFISDLWAQPTADQPAPERRDVISADKLLEQLDVAEIQRAVVLSLGYIYGDPRRVVAGQEAQEYAKVRAENDWTAAQVARFSGRLIAFCGLSPLRPYALEEMARCRDQLKMRGLKLHLGNSGVNLRNPEHLKRLAEVFHAADELGMPIVVHMRSRREVTPDYGRPDAENFLNEVVPQAPHITIQIAHMGGSGPGYPPFADEVMGVFADAIGAKDSRTRNIIFDLTTVVTTQNTAAQNEQIAKRIRQVGPQRFLFGADLSISGNPPPGEAWEAFRTLTPLTDRELRIIANNTAPYWRGRGRSQ